MGRPQTAAPAAASQPSGPLVVGVDVGTTSAKATAYDAAGRSWAASARAYPLATPAPGRAEQDADEVCDAACAALAAVTDDVARAGGRVAGVALSAAMHSLLAVDSAGRALTPVLTYADTRAAAQATTLRAAPAAAGLQQRTGTPIAAMSPLCKLRWFAAQEPDVCARAARWISLKEHLVTRLTGATVVDQSMASATGLFDVHRRDWDAEALDLADVTVERLSTPVPVTTVLPARDLGVPVVVGAGDGCLASVGVGALTPDVAALSIGTSGALRIVTDRPDTDATGRLFCYVLDDRRWVVGGSISNGGLVLRWLRDGWLADEGQALGYEELNALAAAAPPGADGLLCLPYLTGERAPQWDAGIRGMLLGVDLRHGRAHLVRAALEGVALQLRWVATAIADAGAAPSAVRATGGFTRSPLWLQIVADVLDRPLSVPTGTGGSTLGAALLGHVALGLLDDVTDVAIPPGAVVRPRSEAVAVYDGVFARFTAAYGAMRGAATGPPTGDR